MHFLMSCSKYDKTRQDLFSIVGITCINFQNLSIEEIFLWLMTCENDLVLKEMFNLSVNIVDDFFFFLTFLFHFVLLHWTRGGVYPLLSYIFLSTTLGVPLQNDNMKAHIYFYQFIQF
jgi:hypothetical protein